jgi:hypothetical protein
MATKPLVNQRERPKAQVHQGLWWLDCGTVETCEFSYESHVELQLRSGCRRRPMGLDRFNLRFTKMSLKHSKKVMVRGCFSWNGRGETEFLLEGEMMNGQCYLKLLNDKLDLFIGLHRTTNFIQDGVLCHKVKILMKWFQEKLNIISSSGRATALIGIQIENDIAS